MLLVSDRISVKIFFWDRLPRAYFWLLFFPLNLFLFIVQSWQSLTNSRPIDVDLLFLTYKVVSHLNRYKILCSQRSLVLGYIMSMTQLVIAM